MLLHNKTLNPADIHKPNLTFIHGWASNSDCWIPFAESFMQDYQVHLLDLPGFGKSPELQVEGLDDTGIIKLWIQSIQNSIYSPTNIVGWSLGGVLAQSIAIFHPEDVISLSLVTSTPKFIKDKNWQFAVEKPLIEKLKLSISIQANSVLKKFWSLQFQGSDNARYWIKVLHSRINNKNIASLVGLQQGLQILTALDNREFLSQTKVPALWLLGEQDLLIPKNIEQEIKQTSSKIQVKIIAGAGHMPFLSHEQETNQLILDFLRPNN